jgi:hypothetical protein
MKPSCLARALALVLGLTLTLLPGAAWAWGHAGFHSGAFLSSGHPFGHSFFFHHRFVDHRFIHPLLRTDVVAINPVTVVRPFPHAVWVSPQWQWTGFGWVVLPGRWAW